MQSVKNLGVILIIVMPWSHVFPKTISNLQVLHMLLMCWIWPEGRNTGLKSLGLLGFQSDLGSILRCFINFHVSIGHWPSYLSNLVLSCHDFETFKCSKYWDQSPQLGCILPRQSDILPKGIKNAETDLFIYSFICFRFPSCSFISCLVFSCSAACGGMGTGLHPGWCVNLLTISALWDEGWQLGDDLCVFGSKGRVSIACGTSVKWCFHLHLNYSFTFCEAHWVTFHVCPVQINFDLIWKCSLNWVLFGLLVCLFVGWSVFWFFLTMQTLLVIGNRMETNYLK